MKPFLLATAAAAGFALVTAVHAQTGPEAVPASPPPIQSPAQTPDATVAGQVGTVTQTPDTATDGPAAAATPPAPVAAAPAPTPPAAAPPITPAAVSSSTVCQPRVTSVHFGARGSALSRDNSNAIEQAVDAASVCTLDAVTIAASGEGRLATRRVQAARATLIRQGVPEDRITIAAGAAGGADTGQVDIRMNFAGVAVTDVSAATAAQAPMTPAPEAPQAEPPKPTEAEPTPDA